MSADTLARSMTPSMDEWIGGRTTITTRVADAPAKSTPERGPRVDWQRARHNAVLVVPLLLVNGFAMFGQAQWALDRITTLPVVAWLFAVALESIALFLAAEAHSALMAGDAAVARRVGSYLVAGVVGYLNWTHWAGENVAAGAVFAAFSVLSPWLWAVRSRSMRRAELRAAGLVDARLVRFSASKWALYPVRTFRVWRWAAWEGVQDPAAAIVAYDARPDARPGVPPVEDVAPTVEDVTDATVPARGVTATPAPISARATTSKSRARKLDSRRETPSQVRSAPAKRGATPDADLLAIMTPLLAAGESDRAIRKAVADAPGVQCGTTRFSTLLAAAKENLT